MYARSLKSKNRKNSMSMEQTYFVQMGILSWEGIPMVFCSVEELHSYRTATATRWFLTPVQLNQPKGHQKPRLQMQSDVLPRYMTLCCCFFPLFFKKFEAGPFFWCFSGPKTITKECVHTESTTDVAWLPWGRMPHQNKQEVFLAKLSSWTASTHGWVCLFS